MNQRLYALILSLIIACHSVLLSFPAQASPPAQDPAQQVVKDCVKGGLVAVTAWASVLFLFTPLGPFSAALLATSDPTIWGVGCVGKALDNALDEKEK